MSPGDFRAFHPNIIKVYDVSFSERMPAIVMEYVDGVTLKEYIEQQGVLSWKEAIYFAVQILRALQHAHDKGLSTGTSNLRT
jgi:serine/threonine-protein kinase